jgi:uncharacterized protein (DUF302 family)
MNGLVRMVSKRSFEETFDRLESEVASRGLGVFARIDFGGDAERVGLVMRPARLLVFGNPTAGTPLMVAAPSVAIDLPLKVLVSEDDEGTVWVWYNSPQYLGARHGLPEGLLKNVSGVAGIAESVVS